MDYEHSNKISKFIQDIMVIREQYEKTEKINNDFKSLLVCIDKFNNSIQTSQDKQFNEIKIKPSYYGEGFINNDDYNNYDYDGYYSEKSSISSVETIENNYNNEDNNTQDEENTKNEENKFNKENEEYIFNISDCEQNDEPEQEEKVNQMLAISEIFLRKAKKNKNIITEPLNED